MSDDRVADALLWLEFAVDDLDACRSTPGRHWRPRHVANLAQQAAEKALKAAVVLSDQTPPKTHDLERLRSMLPDGWRSRRHPADLERLSSYGVRARYPDNAIQVSAIESAVAVRQAIAVMRAVKLDFEREGVRTDRLRRDRGVSDG
jgi:HEPN domain-containing protein